MKQKITITLVQNLELRSDDLEAFLDEVKEILSETLVEKYSPYGHGPIEGYIESDPIIAL